MARIKSIEKIKDDKIAYLDDLEKQIASEVICINCKKRWINVRAYYLATIDLECKYCKQTGYVMETGQMLHDDIFDKVCEAYPRLDIYREKKYMFKYN